MISRLRADGGPLLAKPKHVPAKMLGALRHVPRTERISRHNQAWPRFGYGPA